MAHLLCYAPVSCNHCPSPPTPHLQGNSGDDDFSSIKALLKALHCKDLLRVIARLFITVNSTGVYLRNVTSPALTWHCGETQKVTAPHFSLAIPRPSLYVCVGGGGRGGTVVTNDWCISTPWLTILQGWVLSSFLSQVYGPSRLFYSYSAKPIMWVRLCLFECCLTSLFMSRQSVNLATLFLDRLRPKWITNTWCTAFHQ